MEIKVVFYKSSSKYYDSCCVQCASFNSYCSERNVNVLTVLDVEFREKRLQFKRVMDFVRNWTKTEYYIDEKCVTSGDVERLFSVLDCEAEKEREMVDLKYCNRGNGWGCSKLLDVTLREPGYSDYYSRRIYWYDFGHFSNSEWCVDKERIANYIINEINVKRLSFCKFFDMSCIENTINNLPDTIYVGEDSEWEYKYRDVAAGLPQQEIIGVMPKRKEEVDSGLLSLNIRTLLQENENSKIREAKRNTPSITFDDIGGIDDIVQQVREVIELPLLAPNVFEHYHLKPHKGILLYGPPGCGKTLIAKAIANEINAHFISVSGPEILNKYFGQSEENLRKIFNEANDFNPSIIYFDEFDAISARRDADDHLSLGTVVNQLLTLMDGIINSDVCCIASTNRIDMIDDAIKRPGRFDYVIEIKKPSLEGCRAIFKIHTSKMPVDMSFDSDRFVEKYLFGLSGAEIAFVVSEAAYNSIRRTIDIEKLLKNKELTEISEHNSIIEADFIRAATTLKSRKKQQISAQLRYGSD